MAFDQRSNPVSLRGPLIVSQRQSEQTSQTASAPQYTKEDSYSSVNDDEPGFRNILRKAGLSDQSFFAVILTLGGLIGALMMSVAIFGLSFYSDSNIYPSVFTNVIALVVPFTTLIMLVFFTTRLAKLTTLISYAQKTESRLDKTVEIVSLSRVLEQEANQIEARIAKFLSASQTLKHELRSEQNEIETSFVATFSQFKNILGQLEAERRSFFEEINTISQALQMSRDFVSTRIGTLTSDFESAALSAARTLETSISQIATNINTVISKDFAQRSLLEKLIETNEASINSIQEIPEKLSIHIQNALANIHLDLCVRMHVHDACTCACCLCAHQHQVKGWKK